MIRRTVSLGNTRRLRESATMRRISSGEKRTVSRLSAGLAGRLVAVSGFIVCECRTLPPNCQPLKMRRAKDFIKKPVNIDLTTTRLAFPSGLHFLRPPLFPGLCQSLGAAFALCFGQGLGDAHCEASEFLRGAVHGNCVVWINSRSPHVAVIGFGPTALLRPFWASTERPDLT